MTDKDKNEVLDFWDWDGAIRRKRRKNEWSVGKLKGLKKANYKENYEYKEQIKELERRRSKGPATSILSWRS